MCQGCRISEHDYALLPGTVIFKIVVSSNRSTSTNPLTLRAIIAYKLVRGGAALLAAAVLGVLVLTGHALSMRALADDLLENATSSLSVKFAEAAVSAVAPRHLWMAIAGLTLDGTVTVVEGWALHRGLWWGPWLVVLFVGAWVPFELLGFVHHPHWGRALLLVGNVAAALYLVWHARRHQRPQP